MKRGHTQRGHAQHGHAMIELTVAATVMLAFLGGTVQFGYSFYLYNQLVTAVANGARYAASRTYRSASRPDVEKGANAIRNMVVYGDPHPAPDAAPVLPGLKPEQIDVKWILDPAGTPEFVDVVVSKHQINALFGTLELNSRPFVEYPYIGRFAPGESEP